MKDYYKILDVSFGASTEEIKKAYRKMAIKYHPDKNSHPDAEYNFIRATEAYEVLKDSTKRKQFDEFYSRNNNESHNRDNHFNSYENKEKEWSSYGRRKAKEYSSMPIEDLIVDAILKVHKAGKVFRKFIEYSFYVFFVGLFLFGLSVFVFFMVKSIFTANSLDEISYKGISFLIIIAYLFIIRSIYRFIKSFFHDSNKQTKPSEINKKQGLTVVIGILLIIIMGLFPPYNVHSLYSATPEFLGYSFILNSPDFNEAGLIKINFERLSDQWVLTGVLISIVYRLFKD
tara:strand:- start:1226 stop:2086 length:861 start_codon:yes stop_codon:yes gene_type:complete